MIKGKTAFFCHIALHATIHKVVEAWNSFPLHVFLPFVNWDLSWRLGGEWQFYFSFLLYGFLILNFVEMREKLFSRSFLYDEKRPQSAATTSVWHWILGCVYKGLVPFDPSPLHAFAVNDNETCRKEAIQCGERCAIRTYAQGWKCLSPCMHRILFYVF